MKISMLTKVSHTHVVKCQCKISTSINCILDEKNLVLVSFQLFHLKLTCGVTFNKNKIITTHVSYQ